MQILMRLGGRLFSNLMLRSGNIALAMQARGFVGAEQHRLHLACKEHIAIWPNAVALLALPVLISSGYYFHLFH
jgi:energy-coupling factor transporter transmembrane protein EcfT